MKILRLTFLVCLLCRMAGSLSGQPTPAPALPPEARQFDFWLGEWEVFDTDGKIGGHSRIESIADGHALLENWTDADGSTGKSINVYNQQKKHWQQFWVGSSSPVLEMSGGLQDGRMVLSGPRTTPTGGTVIDRITWTPQADGTVRQLWEISADDGHTWRTNFDGLYKRKK